MNTEHILKPDDEEISKIVAGDIFAFLNKNNFKVITYDADWRKFDSYTSVLESLDGGRSGYHATISPRVRYANYEWTPGYRWNPEFILPRLNSLYVRTSNDGLIIMRKGDWQKGDKTSLLKTEKIYSPISSITLKYLSKEEELYLSGTKNKRRN